MQNTVVDKLGDLLGADHPPQLPGALVPYHWDLGHQEKATGAIGEQGRANEVRDEVGRTKWKLGRAKASVDGEGVNNGVSNRGNAQFAFKVWAREARQAIENLPEIAAEARS